MESRMPRISVVVPVYNVEQYLDKCIHSILAQSFTDFELILVDDGSTDKSGEMCDAYAGKDGRIKVIHKKNGGLSDARNAGAQVCRAQYIGFIDSDDYIHQDMYQELYGLIEEKKADMASCGVYNVYNTDIIPQCADTNIIDSCDNITAFGHLLIGKLIPGSSCNKLYKSSFVKTTPFPKGRVYEDAFFYNAFMPKISTVVFTTKPMYYYVHRKQSITTLPFSPKRMDLIRAYEGTVRLAKQEYQQIWEPAVFKYTWANFDTLDAIMNQKRYKELPEYKEVLGCLKASCKHVLQSRYFSGGRKCAMLALMISPCLYKKILRLKKQVQ